MPKTSKRLKKLRAPRTLTLSFEGLCGFVNRSNQQVEVYLPPGHGDHGAHLLMRSDFIDVPASSWMPTTVGLIRDIDEGTGKLQLKQVALFSLRRMEATFSSGTGQPKWQNKNRMIDFTTEHTGSSTLSKDVIKHEVAGVGVVTLKGSTTTLEPSEPSETEDRFTLKKKNSAPKTGTFARIVHWTATSDTRPTIVNASGQTLILDDDRKAWWGTVCNVAPVKQTEGLMHFKHYYEAVKLKDSDFPMTIENAFANVYDCVPSVAWV